MADTNWTLGPWWTDGTYSAEEYGVAVIAANTDCGPIPGNPTRGMVAWVNEFLVENAAQCEANAHLIAAAPTLYEALAEAVDHYGKPGGPWNVPNDPGGWLEKARAALALARGGECPRCLGTGSVARDLNEECDNDD